MFAVRQVCEKYQEKRNVFWAFIALEKAYDTIDRLSMCAVAMNVWSWINIVESTAEFSCR